MQMSLKSVARGPINNIPALVQIMAWRRSGDKPLSEPMMAYLNDAYMRHSVSMSYIYNLHLQRKCGKANKYANKFMHDILESKFIHPQCTQTFLSQSL